eukprot:SAG31_NODE_1297_length_8934_cov_26.567176_8_plen_38_part_00
MLGGGSRRAEVGSSAKDTYANIFVALFMEMPHTVGGE